MKRLRDCLLLLLLFGVTMGCVGCGEKKTPYEYLEEFSHLYPLPAGRIYDSLAEEGAETYLDPAIFALLYARDGWGDDREDIYRFSIFLGTSSTHIYEMGIFECYDGDGADEVLGLVNTRLSLLLKSGVEADMTAVTDAKVAMFGKTVVYVVLPDNEKAIRVLERVVR